MLNQQAEKLQAYLDTCHRIAVQAEEAGDYEHLLDPAIFEETLSRLRHKLSARQATPPRRTTTSEKTLQPSFEASDMDIYDRDSLVSDEVRKFDEYD